MKVGASPIHGSTPSVCFRVILPSPMTVQTNIYHWPPALSAILLSLHRRHTWPAPGFARRLHDRYDDFTLLFCSASKAILFKFLNSAFPVARQSRLKAEVESLSSAAGESYSRMCPLSITIGWKTERARHKLPVSPMMTCTYPGPCHNRSRIESLVSRMEKHETRRTHNGRQSMGNCQNRAFRKLLSDRLAD